MFFRNERNVFFSLVLFWKKEEIRFFCFTLLFRRVDPLLLIELLFDKSA